MATKKATQEKQPTPSTTEPIDSGVLTDKQRLFVEEYLQSWNATDAARKAGYSEHTASFIGYENLRKPYIREFIDRRLSESVMSANEALKRLSDQARATLLPFIDITEEGFVYFNFSHPEAKQYMHLIKKVKSKRTRRMEGSGKNAEMWEDEWVEVELYDAQAALEKIGKYHGLFVERTDVTSKGESIAPKEEDAERFDRAISTLASTLGKILPGAGAEPNSPVGTTERTAVESAPKPGG
jgi:phage terminase small subunit